MAKIKTHKSTQKRFKISKTGKLLHDVKGWRHRKSTKTAQIKYRKRVSASMSAGNTKAVRKALPGVGK